MEQVTGPVIAIVFVLTAVFLPVAFLGGLVGEMYRQFAVTIAVSVAISGFVALTLSPALCAALLRPEPEARHPFFQRFNTWFARIIRAVPDRHRLMRHAGLSFALSGRCWSRLRRCSASCRLSSRDRGPGLVLAIPLLQDAASLERTEKATDR
jgi:multidrug efflux pump subunit AcrB